MTHEPDLTLSREDLYELVWSKPMVELAQDLGLSDVALAKRCRKLRVPVPGRGYWARVAAGQEPRQPTLTPRDPAAYVLAKVQALESTNFGTSSGKVSDMRSSPFSD